MNKKLVFQQLFEAESSTFTYLLADAASKEAVLIDSVVETVDRDLKLIGELDLKLKYVLDTHIHADHVTGAGEIRRLVEGVVTAVPRNASVPCADIHLADGDEVKFGSFTIRALETPGHTDASLSYLCEDMVFTGDALLIRGTGRTDFQGGSAEELYDSVTKKLFSLPPDTKVYPAHDYKGFTSSTIEMEQKHNPRLGAGKSKQEFVKIMSELKLAYPKKIDVALPANQACGLPLSEKGTAKNSPAPSLTPEELKSQLGRTLVVDVRGPDEYKGELGHIQGAHQIALGEGLKHFLEGYERSERIVFVCRSGKRSEEAAKIGLEMGFQNVANLIGGMQQWNKLGYPVER
jgi:glyoxylase-like metal-dependent hydrolase (beta-lactamase superfamily II)/rhodanese-related sulfurtransferase